MGMNELATINRPTRAPTLANAVQEWLATQFKGKSRRTKEIRQHVLEEFEIFVGHKPIDRALLIKWNEAQEKRGLVAGSINIKAISIRQFLRWCGECGYMKDPPVNGVIMHRVVQGPLPAIFTEDEYDRIKEASKGTHNYFLTVVGRNTGLSLVDICHLRWSHIDMEKLTILTNRIKTSWRGFNPCRIPFLANSDIHLMLQELQARRVIRFGNENDDWVNQDLRGCYQYSTYQVIMSYGRMLKKLGIKGKSFKNWRNTFISMLVNSGMDSTLAMKITGHTSATIFAAYAKPDWDTLRTGMQKAFQWAESKETVKELRKPNNQ